MTDDYISGDGPSRPITEAEWIAMQHELEGDGLSFEDQQQRQGEIDDALVALVARFGAGSVLLRMRAIYEIFPAAKAAAAERANSRVGERTNHRTGEQAARAMSERQRRADAGRELEAAATALGHDWTTPKAKPKRAMTLQEARKLLGG